MNTLEVIGIVIATITGWIVIQVWVLPKLGFSS